MVKASIEVRRGTASFKVAVQAESVERVLSFAQKLHAVRDLRVKFPIDPELFFVRGPAAQIEMVEPPEKVAAKGEKGVRRWDRRADTLKRKFWQLDL